MNQKKTREAILISGNSELRAKNSPGRKKVLLITTKGSVLPGHVTVIMFMHL